MREKSPTKVSQQTRNTSEIDSEQHKKEESGAKQAAGKPESTTDWEMKARKGGITGSRQNGKRHGHSVLGIAIIYSTVDQSMLALIPVVNVMP